MGIDRTHDEIKTKNYWPNMYKDLYGYVALYVICQTRNLRKVKPPQQETDVPPYQVTKLGVSGPYPKTTSGKKYIIGFTDWYSGWSEAFAVTDQTAQRAAYFLLEEIIPRYCKPLQIVTDNGSENVNMAMKHTLQQMNISHVSTSYYHPQGKFQDRAIPPNIT